MPRSLTKGPYVDPAVLQLRDGDALWSRRSMVLPLHVGMTFRVHTGKAFLNVTIVENMVGHKFGEFASTRVRAVHTKRGKKK